MIKNIPNAIIDIPEREDLYDQQPEFEVLIKKDGKTIYHNKTYAVIMNLVQSITELDTDTGSLEGDTQILCVGHPIVQLFALDQLRQKLEKSGMIAKAVAMLRQVIKNPKLKKELKTIAKKASIKNKQ